LMRVGMWVVGGCPHDRPLAVAGEYPQLRLRLVHRAEGLAPVRAAVATREGAGRRATHDRAHLHLDLRGAVREAWLLGADAARPRTGELRTSAMTLLPDLVPRGVNAAPSLAGLGKPRLEERIEDGLHPPPVVQRVRQDLVGESLGREVFLRRAPL